MASNHARWTRWLTLGAAITACGCQVPQVDLNITPRAKPLSDWRVGVMTYDAPSGHVLSYAATKPGPHLKALSDYTCTALKQARIFRDVKRVNIPTRHLRDNMVGLRDHQSFDAVLVGWVIGYEYYTDGIPIFPSCGRGIISIDAHMVDLKNGIHRVNMPDFQERYERPIFRFGKSVLVKDTIRSAMSNFVKRVEAELQQGAARKKTAPAKKPATVAQAAARPAAPARIPSGPSTYYAVIMGIGAYQSEKIPQLRYTHADAKAVADVLRKTGWFREENVLLLLDEEVTQRAVRRVLGTEMARKLMPNDTLIVYFAGHGGPETDYARAEKDGYAKYLMPYDTDPEDMFSTAVPLAEIATYFDRIEARNVIFISDSCYSGASGGRGFSMMGGRRGMAGATGLEHIIAAAPEGTARVVMSASDINEPVLEVSDYGHGLFTYHLLKGLEGAADKDGDTYVDLHELYSYVYERVLRESKRLGGMQHPILKGAVKGKVVINRVAQR